MRNKYAANHVFLRDGIYYYLRRVPLDLAEHYSVKRLCFSLRTKSFKSALHASKSVTQRLEDYWLGLRLQNMDIPALELVKTDDASDGSCILSEARKLYLRLKAGGKDKVFVRTATRNTDYVIKLLGDRPIGSYSSSEAAQFRDWCLKQGMTVRTVKRVFASIRAIVNIAITEHGYDCSNAFSKTFFPEDENVSKRKPIPTEDIKTIQQKCYAFDDDIRWLIALISDTGMRLGEAVGLLKDDIILKHEVPHVRLIPHPWRRLKTKGSQRDIPLVGASLWACKSLLETDDDSIFAFPRYCNEKAANANSASRALNKWLSDYVPDGCVIHSFRHSMRDRLRTVNCPSDMIDQIGGWTTNGIGQKYGMGFSNKSLADYLEMIKL
ncbi:tyrosine-type recombinase/integrase [Alphaproteobacteria bacterium]|nr:tyrosine-type recombinase/integrase [Alphaproteobacteria bacterium]